MARYDYNDDGYEGAYPRRRPRAGTYACLDKMCGATDCTTCYGSRAGEEQDDNDPEQSERPWLDEAGYTYTSERYGGSWQKMVSNKRRTARRDHGDGSVKAGDIYWDTVFRYVDDESGESRHVRGKWVIQRKSEEG